MSLKRVIFCTYFKNLLEIGICVFVVESGGRAQFEKDILKSFYVFLDFFLKYIVSNSTFVYTVL